MTLRFSGLSEAVTDVTGLTGRIRMTVLVILSQRASALEVYRYTAWHGGKIVQLQSSSYPSGHLQNYPNLPTASEAQKRKGNEEKETKFGRLPSLSD